MMASNLLSIHPKRHWRGNIIGVEHGFSALPPIRSDSFDHPFWVIGQGLRVLNLPDKLVTVSQEMP